MTISKCIYDRSQAETIDSSFYVRNLSSSPSTITDKAYKANRCSIQQTVQANAVEIRIREAYVIEHAEFLNVLADGIEAGFHIKVLNLEQENERGRQGSFADEDTLVEYGLFFFLFVEQDKIREFHSTRF